MSVEVLSQTIDKILEMYKGSASGLQQVDQPPKKDIGTTDEQLALQLQVKDLQAQLDNLKQPPKETPSSSADDKGQQLPDGMQALVDSMQQCANVLICLT